MRLILAVAIALQLSTTIAAPPPAQKQDVAPCCRQAAATRPPTDKSLYLLESKWTSDRNVAVPLSVLRGRVQVAALFFTHCEYACPILVHDMKKLQTRLPVALRGQTDFVLVTMDPNRDSPEVLAQFRAKSELPLDSWSLLRGGADDVRELAALLGVSYAPDSRGQFAHSNLLTVLNAEGEICFQQAGLQADPAALIDAIARACAQAPAPSAAAR
jgi:protein SCO1/2